MRLAMPAAAAAPVATTPEATAVTAATDTATVTADAVTAAPEAAAMMTAVNGFSGALVPVCPSLTFTPTDAGSVVAHSMNGTFTFASADASSMVAHSATAVLGVLSLMPAAMLLFHDPSILLAVLSTIGLPLRLAVFLPDLSDAILLSILAADLRLSRPQTRRDTQQSNHTAHGPGPSHAHLAVACLPAPSTCPTLYSLQKNYTLKGKVTQESRLSCPANGLIISRNPETLPLV